MTRSRMLLVAWSIAMFCAALWVPAGYWTIDDAVKAIAAETGKGVWGTPIVDGKMRANLPDASEYPVLVAPFVERVENGVAPGFSPYARLLAGLESLFSRRALLLATTVIAVGLAWTLEAGGLAWGFILLPLTFYGIVPWEHGLALCLSTTALISQFIWRKSSLALAARDGALLAGAAVFRPEHTLLVAACGLYLLLEKKLRRAVVVCVSFVAVVLCLTAFSGHHDMLRQILLNSGHSKWLLTEKLGGLISVVFSVGYGNIASIVMVGLLMFVLLWMDRANVPRVLRIILWGAVGLYAVLIVKGVWSSTFPPLALLKSGSLAFATPWILWLFLKRETWKTKAMAVATAVLVIGALLLPQTSGVHWGARLLMFTAPLFLIALYQAGLNQSAAFTALLALGAVQAANSAVLVYARYSESTQHIERIGPHVGSPLITATRAQAIDLAPLWNKAEFFTASTPEELRSLLVEFYDMEQDSAWLHLDVTDSLWVHTFPDNRPIWPHRMTITNSGAVYKSQWRTYQLYMNRSDTTWIPILENAAAHSMQAGQDKRALFLLDDVLRLAPDRATTHSNMALLLARLGKSVEAKRAVARALELDSTLVQAQELARQLEVVSAK